MAEEKEETEDLKVTKFSPSFDPDGIPLCLQWGSEDVAEWIAYLGFPQYQACFLDNLINGRKLVTIDASTLPRIGIIDFEHTKFIARKIREMTGLEEPDWNRSIALQHRERLGLFLEKKCLTGSERDSVSYNDFNRYLDKMEEHSPFKRVVYPVVARSKKNISLESGS